MFSNKNLLFVILLSDLEWVDLLGGSSISACGSSLPCMLDVSRFCFPFLLSLPLFCVLPWLLIFQIPFFQCLFIPQSDMLYWNIYSSPTISKVLFTSCHIVSNSSGLDQSVLVIIPIPTPKIWDKMYTCILHQQGNLSQSLRPSTLTYFYSFSQETAMKSMHHCSNWTCNRSQHYTIVTTLITVLTVIRLYFNNCQHLKLKINKQVHCYLTKYWLCFNIDILYPINMNLFFMCNSDWQSCSTWVALWKNCLCNEYSSRLCSHCNKRIYMWIIYCAKYRNCNHKLFSGSGDYITINNCNGNHTYNDAIW